MKKIVPAKKTNSIKYAIRDIIVLADEVQKSGKEMYYLNIGDPNVYDFQTPDHIRKAAIDAIEANYNGYSGSSGIKEAIDSVNIDAKKKGIENILDTFITTGAAEAIEVSLTALMNSGENFLTPSPGYPLYTAIESKLECEHNPYYLDESNGWQPDTDDIRSKINSKTKAIVLINPNNPTGSVASKEILNEILEIAVENNLVVFADEIYDKLIFEGSEMISIASLNQDASCITFSGMSKNFMAPGWRLGWGIVSGKEEILSDYIEAINKILRSRVSANHPLQYGIAAALLGDQTDLEESVEILQGRRDLITDEISKIDGVDLVTPQGSFYAFPSIDVNDDWDFCIELLKETGVIVVPGAGFGQKPGTSHFRIVTCPTDEILTIAFRLIGDFFKKYKEKNG